MSSAALDRLLGVLVVAVLATGLWTLRAGHSSLAMVYAAHGVLAWALAAAVAWKLARSVPRALAARRWRSLALAGAVAAVTVASIAGGVWWAASGSIPQLSGWTLLTLHAYAGIALVPLLIVHVGRRRWRLFRPGPWLKAPTSAGDVPRRAVLAGGGLAIVGLAIVGLAGWSAGWLLDAFRRSERRFTGSRWLPAGGIPPATTFFGEGTPSIDPSAWRLAVRGRVAHPATYDLAAFEALGSDRWPAVLDCTSGWAMDTDWTGVPTAALLAAAEPEPGATRVEVRSITGWGAGLSLQEAARTLLATHVAGEPLPAGNGAPCRLVVPDRRGLDWVKWVVDIEVA